MTRKTFTVTLMLALVISALLPMMAHASTYSRASDWAKAELDKANATGLIPNSLDGADMTQPITREEFVELAVLLYEKASGKTAAPVSPNPFTDTTNTLVLKAVALGIANGTSATTFAPKELTNREQVATMLSRTLRAITPDGDFSTTGAPTFSDQADISAWALEHVLYMAKLGIIKGSDGKFMPRATTAAQVAAGYATTTREQAIAMGVRSFETMGAIRPANTESVPADLIGRWLYTTANGSVGYAAFYEFMSDGTYHQGLSSSTSYTVFSTVYMGNYRVSGNKILFFNRKKSTVQGTDWMDIIFRPSIDDVPVEDVERTFLLKDRDHLVLGETEYGRLK
ncbi:MAG TPA: S-layer homology domain-containing protein [Symbiobacteriaceae bacterium]|nr:S-layer homology domain-containing protein [Symbiobacteriaceae bacterium]